MGLYCNSTIRFRMWKRRDCARGEGRSRNFGPLYSPSALVHISHLQVVGNVGDYTTEKREREESFPAAAVIQGG